MKRKDWVRSLALVLFASSSFTVPVRAMSFADEFKYSDVVVAADAGPNEFDDLPEGNLLRLQSSRVFALRKQQFKLLNVYKNTTNVKLNIADELWLTPIGSVCFEFPAFVEKEKGKLKLTTITPTAGHESTTVSYEDIAKPRKVVLFLHPVVTGKHVEWVQNTYSRGLDEAVQKELDTVATKPVPVKKVVQIGSECSTENESKVKEAH